MKSEYGRRSPVSQSRLVRALLLLSVIAMGCAVVACGQTEISTQPTAAAIDTPLYAVKIDGKWGYIDQTGTMVIPAKYDAAYGFHEGLAIVEMSRKKGYIDKTGTMVIDPQDWYSAGVFSEGLAEITFDDGEEYKSGFINMDGDMVIPARFDEAQSFSEGLAAVELDGKWGYVDQTGEMVIPAQYDLVGTYFSEGLAGVNFISDEQGGFINKNGTMVIGPQPNWLVGGFSEGLANVTMIDTGKVGFIDKTGAMVIPAQYEQNTFGFSEGLAPVESSDGKGYIDPTGNMVIEPQFLGAFSFQEGRAAVAVADNSSRKPWKYGFIDKTGAMVIPAQYDDTIGFYEGLAPVELDGKWGFIDKTGAMVIPAQFEGVHY